MNYESRLPEIIQTILPLNFLGLDYRWEGPFGSVSDAGPIGAFIFMYGFFRKGFARIIILSGGLLILVTAFSFSSIFATVAALAFLIANKLNKRFPQRQVLIYAAIFLTVFGFIAMYIWVYDKTLNGRTLIWLQYISELPNHLFFGAGSQFLSTRVDLLSHDHGHNLYVDTLLRYGSFGFILFLVMLIALGRISLTATQNSVFLPFTILIVFAMCVVGESLVLWRYNGILVTWLILSALIANSAIGNKRGPSSAKETL